MPGMMRSNKMAEREDVRCRTSSSASAPSAAWSVSYSPFRILASTVRFTGLSSTIRTVPATKAASSPQIHTILTAYSIREISPGCNQNLPKAPPPSGRGALYGYAVSYSLRSSTSSRRWRWGLTVQLISAASFLNFSTLTALCFTGWMVPAPATQPPGQAMPSSR